MPASPVMEYRTFGRTGMRVSVAGLGGGGASRLGLATGSSEAQAVTLVRSALDLGINYFDTAENYGTEEVMGKGLAGRRDEVFVSSKIGPRSPDGTLLDREGLRSALEASLRNLGTDVLDVFHLHRLSERDYEYCRDVLLDELAEQQAAGKIRFTGVSESTSADPTHEAMRRAAADGCWDVVMVTFNLFNQSARETVFPSSIASDVAIEIMASAREAFSRPEQLAEELRGLIASDALDGVLDSADPLSFYRDVEGVESLTDVSYRFAAYEPGVHVVLVGTGNPEHLAQNVRSLTAGPLPLALRERLVELFGHLSAPVFVPGRSGGH